MNLKTILFPAFILVTALPGFSQEVQWMSFTDAVKQNQKTPKKILIDVYARWCSNCKRMDASTFKDTAVASYINSHYYPVKLDAETRDSIAYRNQVFVYNPKLKVNELADLLIGSNQSYPNFVFLDESFTLITNVLGYQAPDEFKPILVYFSDDKYKTQTWEEFQKQGEK